MNEEIKKANAAAISLKDDAKIREKKLEDQILQHQRNKIAREEQEVREAARIKEEKERETQRLRELQERANDRQAELDEVRARKAFEAAEQKAANERKQTQAKKQALLKDLEVSRRRQFKDKEMKIAAEARLEREMAMRTMQAQKESEDKERRLHDQKRAEISEFSVALKSQIRGNQDKRDMDKEDYFEQGRKTKAEVEAERQKILLIRDKKMHQLSQMPIDIPEQYKEKLAKKKATF